MNIEIKEINYNTKLVSLDGELDTTTIGQADKIIDPLIKEIKTSFLIFDLSRLTYINSTALTKLIQYHARLKAKKGCLKIFGVSTFVRETMDVCGALKILDIYETQEEAMENLR